MSGPRTFHVVDGTPPPDREFMDPTPAKKTLITPPSTFPTAADETGPAAVFVSSNATPVQVTYTETLKAPAESERQPALLVRLWKSMAQ